ncbi:L-2-hydroxyglutarate oxidase [Rhodohalobacter mucosus]|uniref:L-2-hydroxyglutarate oxidase n=1 Tax=Rhodohalobacter mucosus TaxID=2079485 RepID=A0A316U3V4_9BACT|nr:L-2-hydroxyglutarate oxidase [Rhodohalobacter mucosus]PWN08186.1 L-2-hydroxyglutarate oxidase [Rhodohalobacter mucosus]
MTYDFLIVGAGIVGLSTAYKLSKAYPDANILVLEKEDRVAAHQTGRNSGVIHSGIYYKPGSYKARNCVEGRHELVAFCREHGITHEVCGKVIVATDESEKPGLEKIYQRGLENEIEGISMIGPDEMKEIEPWVNGIQAIHVPCSGIVDYAGVCRKLAELLNDAGNEIRLNSAVKSVYHNNGTVTVQTGKERISARYLINCAGLHSDRIAHASGITSPVKIVPFRGEYYELTPNAQHKVKALIYPVPNPEFPFLGVHFTRMALGGVECGPNAVFAFKREGYEKTSFDINDVIDTFNFPGFWKLAGNHWRMGIDELYRSFSKQGFLENLQKLIPSIGISDITESPSGVRAMALKPDGEILDDFYFETTENEVHVLNAPSPAATAGLAIGSEITEKVKSSFGL